MRGGDRQSPGLPGAVTEAEGAMAGPALAPLGCTGLVWGDATRYLK